MPASCFCFAGYRSKSQPPPLNFAFDIIRQRNLGVRLKPANNGLPLPKHLRLNGSIELRIDATNGNNYNRAFNINGNNLDGDGLFHEQVNEAGDTFQGGIVNNNLEIQAVPAPLPSVPAPLPLLGVGVAFRCSRSLRSRLKQLRGVS